MNFPTARKALEDALANPNTKFDDLREAVVVVLDGLNGSFALDPTNECRGLELWRDGDNYVRVRNYILTCGEGNVLNMVDLRRLHQERTSVEEPRVEILFGRVFPKDKDAVPFDYGSLVESMEKHFGGITTGSRRLRIERQFKVWDRQRLQVETFLTHLNRLDVAYGSSIVMGTGYVEVFIRHHPTPEQIEEMRNAGRF